MSNMKNLRKSIVALLCGIAGIAAADVQLPIVTTEFNTSSAKTVIWRNVKLCELTRFYAAMAGSSEPDALGRNTKWFVPGRFIRYEEGGGLGVQFAVLEPKYNQIKCTKLVFSQEGDDIAVSVAYSKYATLTASNTPETYNFDTGGNSGNYALANLVAFRAGRERVSYSPFLTTADADAKWTVDSLERLGNFRALISGVYASYPQTALSYFPSNAQDAAELQLQSFQSIYPATPNYTRYMRVALSRDTATGAVSARAWRAAFGSVTLSNKEYVGYPGDVDLDDKAANWNNQSVVSGNDRATGGIAIRNFTAEKSLCGIRRSSVHVGFITDTDSLLFRNFALSNVVDMAATFHAGGAGPSGVYHLQYDPDAKTLAGELQSVNNTLVQCIGFLFRQDGNDVWGRATYVKYRGNNVANPAYLGYNFATQPANDYKLTTSITVGGYGMRKFSLLAVDSMDSCVVWTGGQSGDWTDGGNWSTGVAPSAGDVVAFTNFNNAVTVTGASAFPVSAIETFSSRMPVVFACPVEIASGDFEPSVSQGGLVVSNLTVAGLVAPKGPGVMKIEGQATAGGLSLGNAVRREDPALDYGFLGAVVYEIGGNGVSSYGTIAGLDVLQKEILRLSGTNTFASPLMLATNTTLAVRSGRSRFVDLMPIDGGVRVIAESGAEVLVDAFTNLYCRSISFEGGGRVAFGAGGYPEWATNSFTCAEIAADGSDWTFAGRLNTTNSSVVFSAADLDGTPRTISIASTADIDVPVTVSAGCIAASGEVNLPSISVSGTGRIALSSAGCFVTAGQDVDISSVPIEVSAANLGKPSVIWKANSFTGLPLLVRDAETGKSVLLTSVTVDGMQELRAARYKGFVMSIR